jgi:hypothetical protein
MFTTCRLEQFPIVDGKLPLMPTENSCRLVSDVSPPMLVGIAPLTECILDIYKYCSFDSWPIVVGMDPDSEYR